MNKNTIITILLIIIAALSILLFRSKHEYNEAQKLINEIQLKLDEAGDKIKNKTTEIKQELNEVGDKIEDKATRIKNDLKN